MNQINLSLVGIYKELLQDKVLAPGGYITAQQYDTFMQLWKHSKECECFIANCKHYALDYPRGNRPNGGGSVLLPTASCITKDWPDDHEVTLRRSEAVISSLAELIWIFVSVYSLLPVLEIATPVGDIDQLELNEFNQPWISLYFATCGAYFFEVEKKGDVVNPTSEKTQLVGWLDELLIADYVNKDRTETLDLTAHDQWLAYLTPKDNNKIKLPAYFFHLEYFTDHNAEIVALYEGMDDAWTFSALNGLEYDHQNDSDPIKNLFGGSNTGFDIAVRENIHAFRPWFIAKVRDPCSLQACDANHLSHRCQHLKLLEQNPSYAITLTHNLMTQPFDLEEDAKRDTASSFTTVLITVPDRSREKLSIGTDKLFSKIAGGLWDSIDILKMPISRWMMREKVQQLEQQNTTTRRLAKIYEDIQEPLNGLLALSNSLTDTASKLSMIRGDHLQSLHTRRYQLAMLFEDGNPLARFGDVKVSSHSAADYKDYNEFAAAVLAPLVAIDADKDARDLLANDGLPATQKLKYELERLLSKKPVSSAFSIMAPRAMWAKVDGKHYDAGEVADELLTVLQAEWLPVDVNEYELKPDQPKSESAPARSNKCPTSSKALKTLKRRVHSNFKPASVSSLFDLNQSSDKATTLDDLVCLLDHAFSVASDPPLSHENFNELCIFHGACFPFRSVGDFLTALRIFFKGKELTVGTVSFQNFGSNKTVSIGAHFSKNKGRPVYIIDPDAATRISEVLNQLVKVENSIDDGLILGDFYSPLVSLFRGTVPELRPVAVVEADSAGNREIVIQFGKLSSRHFEWRIGQYKMVITSIKGTI